MLSLRLTNDISIGTITILIYPVYGYSDIVDAINTYCVHSWHSAVQDSMLTWLSIERKLEEEFNVRSCYCDVSVQHFPV